MADMGLQIARVGVEWARIEPEDGVFDQAAIDHYVTEIRWLNAHHIKPLVTLHHFTNPMWFEGMGAFEKRANVQYFMRFVTRMVQAFGADVTEYLTINEPNVYAMLGYYYRPVAAGKEAFPQSHAGDGGAGGCARAGLPAHSRAAKGDGHTGNPRQLCHEHACV